ncbi:annexin A13-like isoform X1 [Amphiura filiformis]|uniref:annexin A13-like isoform X1 n=2 Tax=Amphiura filiformis TaxID=82378 RepID=UPI003B21126C
MAAEFIIKYRLARAALELAGTMLAWEDFDAEADADALRKAMRGIGTDEDEIIEILANRNNEQRQEIKEKFTQCFGKDLVDELKSELRGNFEQAVEALLDAPPVYDAKCLRRAMACITNEVALTCFSCLCGGYIKGAGTDENVIIEIMCTRMNEEIEAIKEAYSAEFDRDLSEDLESETSGDFKYLLVSIAACGRDESDEVDEDKAQEDAQELFDAGEDRWGTDESTFNRILVTRNFNQLRATFVAYEGVAGCSIEDSINDETSGNLQTGYLAIVNRAKHSANYFAERLHDSMAGGGTDDDTLIRVIVSRSEIDLLRIKAAFFVKYEKGLASWVEEDTSGDYKKILLGLIKGDDE